MSPDAAKRPDRRGPGKPMTGWRGEPVTWKRWLVQFAIWFVVAFAVATYLLIEGQRL